MARWTRTCRTPRSSSNIGMHVLARSGACSTDVRGDVVQLDYSDPLYDAGLAAGRGPYDGCTPPGGYCHRLPQSRSHTAWYGLYNGNISVVYSPVLEDYLHVPDLQQGSIHARRDRQ